ncbi:Acetyltransferase (GNAT) family protein [Clostridium amylolyticum]|uniref:Acetyltransferase (GNAT) family protein n=1 Tax=Clostridium amylolyticum TaxID=1121298 RepID=A0A1M6I450_9CLOT|nr:GNAT family N-acetyltransferase [Clostridium amylolyticum]SHJ29233.1 Acetyltransferase (GNAT) family protein [Clostridium amylolyticum]
MERKSCYIKLKDRIDKKDYKDINALEKLCLEEYKIALKLELDYKLKKGEDKHKLDAINEFMYYEEDKLIGYIGICDFGGEALEVNGMVHPKYRRMGVFKKLFSLVKDEWEKRKTQKMLLLSDNNSTSGMEFINSTGAIYGNSEYEMFLKSNTKENTSTPRLILRKATNADAKEIAWQNSIYFNIEFKEEVTIIPEEEEKLGTTIYIAEVKGKIIGKVHLGINGQVGGIYGLGILPEYRGKGYGRDLLISAIEKLKEQNLKDIMLQVVVTNKRALNLYKSCGFQETSTMNYYELSK